MRVCVCVKLHVITCVAHLLLLVFAKCCTFLVVVVVEVAWRQGQVVLLVVVIVVAVWQHDRAMLRIFSHIYIYAHVPQIIMKTINAASKCYKNNYNNNYDINK